MSDLIASGPRRDDPSVSFAMCEPKPASGIRCGHSGVFSRMFHSGS